MEGVSRYARADRMSAIRKTQGVAGGTDWIRVESNDRLFIERLNK